MCSKSDHNRLATGSYALDEVTVELTLETRGESHVTELLAHLSASGYRPHRIH